MADTRGGRGLAERMIERLNRKRREQDENLGPHLAELLKAPQVSGPQTAVTFVLLDAVSAMLMSRDDRLLPGDLILGKRGFDDFDEAVALVATVFIGAIYLSQELKSEGVVVSPAAAAVDAFSPFLESYPQSRRAEIFNTAARFVDEVVFASPESSGIAKWAQAVGAAVLQVAETQSEAPGRGLSELRSGLMMVLKRTVRA